MISTFMWSFDDLLQTPAPAFNKGQTTWLTLRSNRWFGRPGTNPSNISKQYRLAHLHICIFAQCSMHKAHNTKLQSQPWDRFREMNDSINKWKTPERPAARRPTFVNSNLFIFFIAINLPQCLKKMVWGPPVNQPFLQWWPKCLRSSLMTICESLREEWQ